MKAFVINLDKYPKRWQRLAKLLSRYGFKPERVPGVTTDKILGECTSKGDTGCTLAHFEVAKRIVAAGECCLVFEDDVIFHKQFAGRFPTEVIPLLSQFPVGILGTSQRDKLEQRDISENLNRHYCQAMDCTWGTFAYWMHPSAAQQLLDTDVMSSADVVFTKVYYQHSFVPVMLPYLCIQDMRSSDTIFPPVRIKMPRMARLWRIDLSHYEWDAKQP